MEYPTLLHDYHSDFPFCSENKKIENMKHRKLRTDLNDKRNYIIHYRNLQQCIQYSLILKNIHRILQSNQLNWLKKYIVVSNHHRTLAKNIFKQNFFQLLNNAMTMENVDKRNSSWTGK